MKNNNIIGVKSKVLKDKIDKLFKSKSRDEYLTKSDLIRDLLEIGLKEITEQDDMGCEHIDQNQ